MAADLFVLVKGRPDAPWGAIAGPVDVAGATAAVQGYNGLQPGARVAVVQVVRTFQVALQVTQDAQPVITP